MRIYFSGIGGVGIGPLAEIARDAGYDITGSDQAESPLTQALSDSGVAVHIGQDGSQLAGEHTLAPIDWFVYTAALPDTHPELVKARELGIKTAKRDELIARILNDKQLKLIAVAGTHGKTTTSGMMVWAMKQLDIPVSYSVGASLSFGPSGAYDPASEYFVYECDEYDRNMLHFSPHLSLITSLDYDHPDTYPTKRDYQDAFIQFLEQSDFSLLWEKDLRALEAADMHASYEAYDELMNLDHLTLAGDHVRHNAFLVQKALERLMMSPTGDSFTFSEEDVAEGQPNTTGEQPRKVASEENEIEASEPHNSQVEPDNSNIIASINSFPGTNRRMEKLADKIYSDYGHHPAEIAATLQLARELSDHVVLVYQPHQNIRQHEIRDQYTDIMEQAETIYWLPTYLSREDPNLEVLTPEQLSSQLSNKDSVVISNLDDELWQAIQDERAQGRLVLCMGAGSIDNWLRSRLSD